MGNVPFIAFVAVVTFVVGAAMAHGRRPRRVQRAAVLLGGFGIASSLPIPLVVTAGAIANVSTGVISVLADVGYAGLAMATAAGVVWLAADAVFVWRHRRQIFPFAFGRRSG